MKKRFLVGKLLSALCAFIFTAAAFAQGTAPASSAPTATSQKVLAKPAEPGKPGEKAAMKSDAPKPSAASTVITDAGKPSVRKVAHKTKKKATPKTLAEKTLSPEKAAK